MEKIVITGATSMIGVALVEECIMNNVQVLALVRKNSRSIERLPKSNLITIVECNLNEMKIFKINKHGFDAFYHFAWSYTDKAGRMSPELQQKNIQYSLDALKLAARLGCRKFIGAGSQAEYGRHVDEKTKPDSLANPIIPYGISKYAAGKLCLLLAQQNGMDFFWVRIFSVYGKYDQPDTMISSTIKKMLNGEHCSFTAATQQWDYLYSSDAARAFYLIGEKSAGNKVYCLGSGETRPLYEYIYILRNAINQNIELGIGEIPYKDSTVMNLCADISQLTQDTGFIPTVSFNDGIRQTIVSTFKRTASTGTQDNGY